MNYIAFSDFFSSKKQEQEIKELKQFINLVGFEAASSELWDIANFVLMMHQGPTAIIGKTNIYSYSFDLNNANFEFSVFEPNDDRKYTAYWYYVNGSDHVNGDGEYIDHIEQIKNNFKKHAITFLEEYVRN